MTIRGTERFERGRKGEKLISQYLQDRGWYVVPSYDYAGDEKDKAPRMQRCASWLVIPDLDVSRRGKRLWVEVKTKAQASFTRITGRHEHGIQRRHYDDYLRVQSESGCAVYLVIYEESTGDVLCQSLDELSRRKRIYPYDKMGRGGMVFFPRKAFDVLYTVETQREQRIARKALGGPQ